jgi:hypothetical protein
MKQVIISALLLTLEFLGAETTIMLKGSEAVEASGNGKALRIANLSGAGLDADGCLTFIPREYDPIKNFNIGSLSYDEAQLSRSGDETLSVTPEAFAFDFNSYAQLLCNELAVIGTCGVDVTLSNIQGPGLSFVDGVVESLDFTADVSWSVTLNDFSQTAAPYTGNLTVIEGTFIFDVGDDPQNWFVGASEVSLEFDLVARPDAFGGPILPATAASFAVKTTPALKIMEVGDTEVSLNVSFPDPGPGLFRLMQSPDLSSNSWTRVGCDFVARSTDRLLTVKISEQDTSMFYRVESLAGKAAVNQ